MEKIDYLIIVIILIIVLTVSLFRVYEPEKILLGETYGELYSILDRNITYIETNMSEITTGNEGWHELKETNLADEQLKKTYNMLVLDIKKCYLLSNDLENRAYDNIKIMSFKNKEYVKREELLQLNKNESCLKNFDKYNSLKLSDDQEVSEKVKTQLNIIVSYEEEPSTYKDFYELLYDETVKIDKVANLTKWLKMQYDTYTQ